MRSNVLNTIFFFHPLALIPLRQNREKKMGVFFFFFLFFFHFLGESKHAMAAFICLKPTLAQICHGMNLGWLVLKNSRICFFLLCFQGWSSCYCLLDDYSIWNTGSMFFFFFFLGAVFIFKINLIWINAQIKY